MKQPDPSEHPTVALRRLHRWRMALSGLMILIAGITLGAAGTIMIVHPTRPAPAVPSTPEIQTEWTLRAMAPELHLSPEQFEEIGRILGEGFQTLAELREAARPALEEVLEKMKIDISLVLSQDQNDRWERMTRRVDRVVYRGFPPDGRGRRGGRGDGRGGFGGGPDRSGFGGFGGGPDRSGFGGFGERPDSNDFRRMGERGGLPPFDPNAMRRSPDGRSAFPGFDPNFMRRSPDGRGDPNGSSRRMMDFRGGREGPDRSFGRRGGMGPMMVEPNGPPPMPTGGEPIEPNVAQ